MSKVPTMAVCPKHDRRIPLIWTYAFKGFERWCPCCGRKFEVFDNFEDAPITEELQQSHKQWKEKSKEYLDAILKLDRERPILSVTQIVILEKVIADYEASFEQVTH